MLTFEPIPPTYTVLRRNVRDNLGTSSAASGELATVLDWSGDGDDEDAGRQIPDRTRGQLAGPPDAGGDSRNRDGDGRDGGDRDDGNASARGSDTTATAPNAASSVPKSETSPSSTFPEAPAACLSQSSSPYRSSSSPLSSSSASSSSSPLPPSPSPASGSVWAYNCGVSDGSQPSARFTFYPRAAGWSTMHPDDAETADNVKRFVESTLQDGGGSGGDGGGGGLEKTPLASFGKWLLRAIHSGEDRCDRQGRGDGGGGVNGDVEGGLGDGSVDGGSSKIGGGGGGVFAAAAQAVKWAARLLFTSVMGLILKRLLGAQREFDCPLVTVSDIIDSHGLGATEAGADDSLRRGGGVGLLKVDVERAELAVLRGVKPSDWPLIRQVAMEVHDAANGGAELAAVIALLVDVGGFQPGRVVVEQPPGLEGSTLWNLYARR